MAANPPNPRVTSRLQISIYLFLLLIYCGLGFFLRVLPPPWIYQSSWVDFLIILQIGSLGFIILVFVLLFNLVWKRGNSPQGEGPSGRPSISSLWQTNAPYRALRAIDLMFISIGILFVFLFLSDQKFTIPAITTGEFVLMWFGLFLGFSITCFFIFSGIDAFSGIILISMVTRSVRKRILQQQKHNETFAASNPMDKAFPLIIRVGRNTTEPELVITSNPHLPRLENLPSQFRRSFLAPLPSSSCRSPVYILPDMEDLCLANHVAPSYRLFPTMLQSPPISPDPVVTHAAPPTIIPPVIPSGMPPTNPVSQPKASINPQKLIPTPIGVFQPATLISSLPIPPVAHLTPLTPPIASPPISFMPPPPTVMKMKTIPSESPPDGLIVYPEVGVSGNRVKLSFILRNRTQNPLYHVRVFPRIPEALHIYTNVTPVPKISPGEKTEVSYEVEPSTCGEFYLGGDVLYEDGVRTPQWIAIPPVAFSFQCPTLSPVRVNMSQIRAALPQLAQVQREYLVSDFPRELLGQVTQRAMASFNLTPIESLHGTNPLGPSEAWFAGKSAREQYPLYVQVQVLGQPARVIVSAWSVENETVAGFLARLADVLTTELSIVRHLQDQARDKITHAARIGELLVTLSDFCMIEWHRTDTCVKLQELANLLSLFDASTPILAEVREWVQKLSMASTNAGISSNLSPADREQLEATLVKWKDAFEQILTKFSLQIKEVTPNAVPV